MTDTPSVRIVFFGTSDFAVPSLEALVKTGHRVVGVVTRPDERAGRKQILTPPPVKIAAERLGIPIFQPAQLDARDFTEGKIPRADACIVAAYGKIIPKTILDMPRYGCLNIHPSILPRWRGPAPMQYVILHGDTETGVTIMSMDEELDHGPIIAFVKHSMFDKKETYRQLHDALAREGAALLIKILPRWIAGEIAPVPQNHLHATYTKILTRDDGRIDWRKSADEIERMVRALYPWPGAWTLWTRGGTSVRVRIEAAAATDAIAPNARPGLAWQDAAGHLSVAAGSGSLTIQKIGAEGKNVTDAASFVRGYPAIIGAILL